MGFAAIHPPAITERHLKVLAMPFRKGNQNNSK
jgi:hypothetical protein